MSFIRIEGEKVSYVNPSLKDYLSSYMADLELLVKVAPTAKSIEWINNLWTFAARNCVMAGDDVRLASACLAALDMFAKRPVMRPTRRDPRSLEFCDVPNTARIDLLLEWWQLTRDIRVADCVMAVARKPVQGFSPWRDSESLIKYFSKMRNRDYGEEFVYESEFLECIEIGLTSVISYAASDDLLNMADEIDVAGDAVPASVKKTLEDAVLQEFSENSSRVQSEDSESSLNDRIDALRKFAPRFGIPRQVLDDAISTVKVRIADIEDRSPSSSSPSIRPSLTQLDAFDDAAVRDLFLPLLEA